MIVRYRCLDCAHRWTQDRPGVLFTDEDGRERVGPTLGCPNCGGSYFRWENFKEWRKENAK